MSPLQKNILLCVLLLALGGGLAYRSSYDTHKTKTSSVIRGLYEGWQPFTNQDFSPQHISVAKIIFILPGPADEPSKAQYLVATKRAHGKHRKDKTKNSLYEFPGGQVEANEKPLQALLRELHEEDPSQTLALVLKNALDAQKMECRLITLKSGQTELLLKTQITAQNWQSLQQHWQQHKRPKEIYAYTLLTEDKFDLKNKQAKELWTPKTLKILKKLRIKHDSSLIL